MKQKIQVLMIEDDPDYVLLMNLQFKEASGPSLAFTVENADSLKSGLDLLKKKDFDILLLDLMLPDSQGLETLAKARPDARGIPIVVITNIDDEEAGLIALANGAQDFLRKGEFDARLIKRAIGYALERSYWVQQLENIIGNCPDGMVIVDMEGIVRCVNPAGEALFGKSADDMVGRPFGFPVEPNLSSELKTKNADGGEMILDLRATQIEWRRYKATLATIRDITELRRLEQMRAEIKEQRRIDELKAKFLNTVSHELRSPLTVVKAAVANLRDRLTGPLSEPQKHMVFLADRNVDRLARMINNLLDISRLESGHAKINRAPVDILKLIDETVSGVRLAESEKRISLKLDLPSRLPWAHADPDMITQVLINLLDNAMRFARTEVIVRASEAEPEQVEISVSDDGPGIPADKMGDLFNKFVQVDRPAGGSGYKGTGLGLAICQETVKMNWGRLWVECPRGRGAQFHFTLPRHDAGESALKQEARHAGATK